MSGMKTNSGKRLNKEWGVGAQHALFHKDGNWYNHLERFPGAYFDPDGYVLFRTRTDYEECRSLSFGPTVHVDGDISRLPGYHRVK